MPEERNVWKDETNTETETTYERKPQESATGSDKPSGDGGVGDTQVKRASGEEPDGPIGQDHSTENYAENEPRTGVGAIQDSSVVRGPADIDDGTPPTPQRP